MPATRSFSWKVSSLVLLLMAVAAVLEAAGASLAGAEQAPATEVTTVVPLDGQQWLLAVDPQNQGRQQGWQHAAIKEAKPTKVPWVIQDVFPDYHGVAWYWRDFTPPAHFQTDGRYLLKFRAVDYLAEVWLNGVPSAAMKEAIRPSCST